MSSRKKLPDNQITVYQTTDGKINDEKSTTEEFSVVQNKYEVFKKKQDCFFESDFDRHIKKLLEAKKGGCDE
jgi:hypothetical protein